MRVVCWFSCGAASAVATKLAVEKYADVKIVYCDTGAEHEDNKRFMADCEKWFNQKITVLKSEKYADTWDVFEKTKYLVGVGGARCTTELK
jgi:3'-phosphoadenosine 5'-phosphosulfate sulfotransferase (PAPS reductase)/FAD synthetase